jgi:hypothetical protein
LVSTALERNEHGTATTYRQGCRCARCRAGLHSAAKQWWAAAQVRKGREPASYFPAARVRKHIGVLEAAGWTRCRIAAAAQVAPATISRVCKPSTRWCSRIVALGVLGVVA